MKYFQTTIAAYRCFSICRSKRFVAYSTNTKKVVVNDKGTKIKFTNEQKLILDAISKGQSVFITGSAGTGKTVLVHSAVSILRKIHGKSKVFVTASTGTAACNINGQTLHSFAGVGWGLLNSPNSPEILLKQIQSNPRVLARWSRVKSLIVDEISMIPYDLFQCLEYIARKIKSRGCLSEEKTWGGIQLVASGDFFQLPPVMTVEGGGDEKVFAFEADCWNPSFDLQVELRKVFRQTDPQFLKVLQGIRKGVIDSEGLEILEKFSSQSEPDPSAVQLFPHSKEVKRVNKLKLEEMGSKIIVYNSLDTGKDQWVKALDKGIAEERLELCVGARVMLIKNLSVSKKLVNGATGTVTRFNFYLDSENKSKNDKDIHSMCEYGNYLPVVKFDSGPEVVVSPEIWPVMEGGNVVAQRKQIPLILAWAMSIHKCQGMGLDSLHTDLRRSFCPAMVYVALSRVKSLAGLNLSGFDPAKVRAHPKVVQFYKMFASDHTGTV